MQRNFTLAVVEDDNDLREELEYHFKDQGYTVWGACPRPAFHP